MGPGDLAKVIAGVVPAVDPRLLVGPETLDDAAVLSVSTDLAICFTADIITPLVDDARAWGRIAAANALSDVYAMGGEPFAALNLMCWPSCLDLELLQEVLAGGAAVASEAGCLIAGGHTLDDQQPKYGLAVLGTVSPERIMTNRGARPGDVLYLTKPLGTGIVTTAIKAELAEVQEIEAATETMSCLNRAAAEAARQISAHGLTDVTGFGLIGHLSEMLGDEATLGVKLETDQLPVLPGVDRLMSMGMIPAGAYRNRDAFQPRVDWLSDSARSRDMLLFDPQTSGGLLAAIAADQAASFEDALSHHHVTGWRIGTFDDSGRISVS